MYYPYYIIHITLFISFVIISKIFKIVTLKLGIFYEKQNI